MGGLYQKQLPLLLAEPADAYEPPRRGGRARGIRIECRFKPAMHHVHLGPIGMRYLPIELAASIRTDRHHEGAAPDLFGKADDRCLVEFFRAVNRKAPAWATQDMHQRGYLG